MSVTQPESVRVQRSAGLRLPAVKPCGFTLLEVLVTLIVLSLGLLGLAGLQAFSLKNNHIAYYRAIASQQAYDIQDRIRANLAGVIGGGSDNLTATLPADPGCIATGCTAAQMAVTDQFQWLTANAAMLAGGSGTVRCVIGPAGSGCVATTGNARVFDITVSWTEKNESGNITQNFVTRFSP